MWERVELTGKKMLTNRMSRKEKRSTSSRETLQAEEEIGTFVQNRWSQPICSKMQPGKKRSPNRQIKNDQSTHLFCFIYLMAPRCYQEPRGKSPVITIEKIRFFSLKKRRAILRRKNKQDGSEYRKERNESGQGGSHGLREDPFHDELRRGGGREGEGAPGRGGGGDPADDGPIVELARGVLRDGAGREERGRRRRRRRRVGRERAPGGGAPGAGEELERVQRRLRRPQLAGGHGGRADPGIGHARGGRGSYGEGRSVLRVSE